MTGIFQKLIWKEWREQRWKIAYMSFLMLSLAVIGLRTRMLPDIAVLAFDAFFGAFLLPIFVGMGLFASEKSEGTLSMLTSLPIKPWKIFTVKMIHAVVICAIPFAVTLAAVLFLAGDREVDTATIVRAYLICYLFSIVFLSWIVGFGIGQPTEARTALVALAVVLAWSFFAAAEDSFNPSGYLFAIVTPFGFIENIDHPSHRLEVFSSQMGIAIVLLIQASIRFTYMRKEKA
jgi:ABC-type transport system involved in multi-copper enzyme maturation permease subunit